MCIHGLASVRIMCTPLSQLLYEVRNALYEVRNSMFLSSYMTYIFIVGKLKRIEDWRLAHWKDHDLVS